MTGRFVNIVIPGKRKTLNLCEVEVYAAPEGTTVAQFDVMQHGIPISLCYFVVFFSRFSETSTERGLKQANGTEKK